MPIQLREIFPGHRYVPRIFPLINRRFMRDLDYWRNAAEYFGDTFFRSRIDKFSGILTLALSKPLHTDSPWQATGLGNISAADFESDTQFQFQLGAPNYTAPQPGITRKELGVEQRGNHQSQAHDLPSGPKSVSNQHMQAHVRGASASTAKSTPKESKPVTAEKHAYSTIQARFEQGILQSVAFRHKPSDTNVAFFDRLPFAKSALGDSGGNLVFVAAKANQPDHSPSGAKHLGFPVSTQNPRAIRNMVVELIQKITGARPAIRPQSKPPSMSDGSATNSISTVPVDQPMPQTRSAVDEIDVDFPTYSKPAPVITHSASTVQAIERTTQSKLVDNTTIPGVLQVPAAQTAPVAQRKVRGVLFDQEQQPVFPETIYEKTGEVNSFISQAPSLSSPQQFENSQNILTSELAVPAEARPVTMTFSGQNLPATLSSSIERQPKLHRATKHRSAARRNLPSVAHRGGVDREAQLERFAEEVYRNIKKRMIIERERH